MQRAKGDEAKHWKVQSRVLEIHRVAINEDQKLPNSKLGLSDTVGLISSDSTSPDADSNSEESCFYIS
ncbi:hypothetical protein Fmac_001438 [Flemingia macrophylla]|uniref:Uncharacterized protein n=1 Tax=Flemingia macrophylla TaxID=520843 RepID=A0ABD1NHU7_9FABA